MVQIDPLWRAVVERCLHQQAVAELRAGGPRPEDGVVPLAGSTDDPVLLHLVHDLLEAEDVRLERRHVGEDERQPLSPPVEEAEDVQRRNVQQVHQVLSAV